MTSASRTASKSEHARLVHMAQRFGFANLDALGRDLFRIGLAEIEGCFLPTSREEGNFSGHGCGSVADGR